MKLLNTIYDWKTGKPIKTKPIVQLASHQQKEKTNCTNESTSRQPEPIELN